MSHTDYIRPEAEKIPGVEQEAALLVADHRDGPARRQEPVFEIRLISAHDQGGQQAGGAIWLNDDDLHHLRDVLNQIAGRYHQDEDQIPQPLEEANIG